MAKQFRKKKKPKGKRGDSLRTDIRAIARKTQLLKEKAAVQARQSDLIGKGARKAHMGVEHVHENFEEAHELIRKIEGRKISKRDGRPGRKAFPVVGIGASAGGFEAIAQLLEELPANTGMAFVFVQHLDPTHKSGLTTLLSRLTHVVVTEIRHRTLIEPNHIYVIPPNTVLSVKSGVLELSPRKKIDHHLPIDVFFQSLARDRGNRAVGVILSGNGHDGAAGLKEIKAGGGITFAQEVSSCKFPGMPESAIATGCVDYILPPAEIARELERISNHGVLKDHERLETSPDAESDLARILGLLRACVGVDFSCYKPTTLRRRINRRMVLKRIESLGDYLKFLQKNRAEIELLFQDILINVTGFFRDREAFVALKKKIFSRIIKDKAHGNPVRIWVPGCATGEEVYSLAICLHEFLGKNRNNKSIQIFGTDISENMVAKARAGIYPRSIASEVSPDRLHRYFQKSDGGYQISKFIRDVCIFAKQNVVEDPPFSKLDLISCRNLLIYLGPALQKKVFPTFHYSLRTGGYLMLGASETIGPFSNLFTLLDKKNKIYLRNDAYSRPEIDYAFPSRGDHEQGPVAKPSRETGRFDLQRKAEEILLGYSPPGVIVNARMDVLHFLGRTGPYLDPATGSASLNLLKIARSELMVDLRTAISQAAKTRSPVRKEGIRMRFNGHFRDVSVEVVPFKDSMPEYLFLVLFRDFLISETAADGKVGRNKPGGSQRQRQAARETQRLRAELGQTKESLQTIIEEQEATNEELKSANEEIQSSNEELQSTNEELETAKEELQSTNEELTTLNEELQNRNSDLSEANNDLNNLIGSFNMPIVMLGNDLSIRRFTPLAQKIFNLIPGDVGRQISDINSNIALPNLKALVTEVIESLNVKEIEVQDGEGHWYSLRVRPYRTSDNKIEGAVIVLVDIGDVRQGVEEVMQMVQSPMLLLTADLKVSHANEAFYECFRVGTEETKGTTIFKLGNGQWNIPALRSLLEQVLPANQHVEGFKVDHEFPQLGRRRFLVNARRLYQHSKGTHYVLVLFRDITG
jgi:two-component system, chemotaxis family, CheB/CheR fusion protein